MAVAMAAITEIFRKNSKGNPGLPKCKPHTVYIYEVLNNNGGIVKMSLAEKLVALRKQKGLTQMDLAEKLNVSRQAVSRWEVGAAVPGTDNLKVLGELYGVSVDYLLNDDVLEATECIQESGNSSTEKEENLKSKILRPIFLFVLVVLIAFMILVLVPWNKQHGRSVPMEGMHTESKGDYSEGTFEFK